MSGKGGFDLEGGGRISRRGFLAWMAAGASAAAAAPAGKEPVSLTMFVFVGANPGVVPREVQEQ